MRFKHLMILAAVSGMAMSCINNFEATPTPQAEIGFGTWAETLTKTPVADPTNPRAQGSSYFRSGDGIVVYGSKVISDASVVFNGVDVVATAEGGTPVAATTWDYNNHRFWDTNASSYTFFAVSPKNKLATTSTTAIDGAFKTHSLSFTGAVEDFLVADKVVVEKGEGPGYFNSYGTVNLSFNHAAALVDVHVKKASTLADATVEISSISLDNIKQVGTLTMGASNYNKTISSRTTVPNITRANWAAASPGTYLPAQGVIPVYGANGTSAISNENKKTIDATDTNFSTGNSTANTTPAASTILFNNLIVVPQEFVAPTEEEIAAPGSATGAQKISITYSITVAGDTNTYTSYLWLSQFDSIDNGTQAAAYVGSWDPGKHYIFYITIDAHAITFSASISDWESTVRGYNYLVN